MSRGRRLSQLGEFGWLKKLLPRLYWPSQLKSQLWIGPGDDAGVMKLSPGKVLVATTDTLVEGVHFERKWLPPRDLGMKLLAVNLSDLAAMGSVTPLAALVTVSMPGDTPVDTVDNFYRGLLSCAQRWKIGFLGGDTVGSKRAWTVSATVFGQAAPAELIRRSGAKTGDWVGVIGGLGLAAGGLEVLQTRSSGLRWTAPLVQAFARPNPQLPAGAVLGKRRLATSLVDASDGLEASVKLLAEASGLGVKLDLDAVPVAPALTRWAGRRRRSVFSYLLRGGEDYALIFTVPAAKWKEIQRYLPAAHKIGRMLPRGQGSWAIQGGRRTALKSYGYAHFKR